jgi:predicted DNA-binding WGR domain protein
MSLRSCQAKMAVRPAPHQHCPTKDDFRISGRAPLPSYPLSLKRYDPAHRIHQYYRLTVQPNLFGAWSLLREWGRIGRPSQMQADLYVCLEATQEAFRRKEREKRQKGYR